MDSCFETPTARTATTTTNYHHHHHHHHHHQLPPPPPPPPPTTTTSPPCCNATTTNTPHRPPLPHSPFPLHLTIFNSLLPGLVCSIYFMSPGSSSCEHVLLLWSQDSSVHTSLQLWACLVTLVTGLLRPHFSPAVGISCYFGHRTHPSTLLSSCDCEHVLLLWSQDSSVHTSFALYFIKLRIVISHYRDFIKQHNSIRYPPVSRHPVI